MKTIKFATYLAAITIGVVVGFCMKPVSSSMIIGKPALATVKVMTQMNDAPDSVFMIVKYDSLDRKTIAHLEQSKGIAVPVTIQFTTQPTLISSR